MPDQHPAAAATASPAPPAPPTAPAAPPTTTTSTGTTPSPLDALSQTDLRIKLEHARKTLRNQLDKKRKIDRDLVRPSSLSSLSSPLLTHSRPPPQATLEQSIYAFEGSYLSDALFSTSSSSSSGGANPSSSSSISGAQFGNIIRGYDSYLKAPSSSGGDRRKMGGGGGGGAGGGAGGANDKERMFSASSATYHRVRPLSLSLSLCVLRRACTQDPH